MVNDQVLWHSSAPAGHTWPHSQGGDTGSNPEGRTLWPRPLRPDQCYESLVVSYQEVVHAQAIYAREFRGAVCARLVVGEKVSSLSKELGVSEATLYLWKRQAPIGAGRAQDVKSFEADELAQAHKTIAGRAGSRQGATALRREEPIARRRRPSLPSSRRQLSGDSHPSGP